MGQKQSTKSDNAKTTKPAKPAKPPRKKRGKGLTSYDLDNQIGEKQDEIIADSDGAIDNNNVVLKHFTEIPDEQRVEKSDDQNDNKPIPKPRRAPSPRPAEKQGEKDEKIGENEDVDLELPQPSPLKEEPEITSETVGKESPLKAHHSPGLIQKIGERLRRFSSKDEDNPQESLDSILDKSQEGEKPAVQDIQEEEDLPKQVVEELEKEAELEKSYEKEPPAVMTESDLDADVSLEQDAHPIKAQVVESSESGPYSGIQNNNETYIISVEHELTEPELSLSFEKETNIKDEGQEDTVSDLVVESADLLGSGELLSSSDSHKKSHKKFSLPFHKKHHEKEGKRTKSEVGYHDCRAEDLQEQKLIVEESQVVDTRQDTPAADASPNEQSHNESGPHIMVDDDEVEAVARIEQHHDKQVESGDELQI